MAHALLMVLGFALMSAPLLILVVLIRVRKTLTLRPRFTLSTVAIAVGGLMVLTSISRLANPELSNETATPWLAMLLGAMAYRSAKRRLLGIVDTTTTRLMVEGAAMCTIVYLI